MGNEEIDYRFTIDKKLWERFSACLRKVYWKEGMRKDKGIIVLIKKFVEENE